MNLHTFTVLTNLVGIIDQELMPNVGRIAVQDYQRLNETLIHARKLLNEPVPCPLETSSDIYKEFTVAMVPSTPARLGERIHEIIAEWLKGCSCASTEHPEDCPACTRGAMDSIAKALDTRKVGMSPLHAAPYGTKEASLPSVIGESTAKIYQAMAEDFQPMYESILRTSGVQETELPNGWTVAQLPEGWKVRNIPDPVVLVYVVSTPREGGVRTSTAVYGDSNDPAQALLVLLLKSMGL